VCVCKRECAREQERVKRIRIAQIFISLLCSGCVRCYFQALQQGNVYLIRYTKLSEREKPKAEEEVLEFTREKEGDSYDSLPMHPLQSVPFINTSFVSINDNSSNSSRDLNILTNSDPSRIGGKSDLVTLEAAPLTFSNKGTCRLIAFEFKTHTHTHKNTHGTGFAMLAKLGWKDGEGLGRNKQGINEPIPVVLNLSRGGLRERESSNSSNSSNSTSIANNSSSSTSSHSGTNSSAYNGPEDTKSSAPLKKLKIKAGKKTIKVTAPPRGNSCICVFA
jgi:hypothetical protein